MSLLALIAAAAGTPVVDPPPDPDPTDGFPTTSDPILQAMRPSGVRILSTVTATPGDDMSALMYELDDLMEPQFETPYGALGPDHHGILFLPPGTYTGGFGTGQWLAIVGTSGNPADVIIHSDTIAADGVMHPYSPVYVEGVTLKGSYNATVQQSPKYAAHISGTGRTFFANCIFDVTAAQVSSAADSSWGCAGSVGMDGGPGTNLIFYGCTFLDVTGQSRLGMNLHGGVVGAVPSKIMFINCTAAKGVGYSYGAGVDVPANVDDELYVIGGTIGGSIVASANVKVFTDKANTVTGTSDVTRSHTTWPQPPSKGLSQFFLDTFYPSGLSVVGTTKIKATVTDTAPMTPVAGRTYYCPIPFTTAYWFSKFGIYVRSGSGTAWSWKPSPAYFGTNGTLPTEPHPDIRGSLDAGTLPSGEMLENYYDRSWVAYPNTPLGGNRMWFAFKIPTTTGVTIDGSAMLPGLFDCYYSDNNGTTITKATAGTPFPLAHAAQVR